MTGESAGVMSHSEPHERFYRAKDKKREYAAQLPGEDEAELPPPVAPIQAEGRVGRNDPCPCGSGKKHKQCCGKK